MTTLHDAQTPGPSVVYAPHIPNDFPFRLSRWEGFKCWFRKHFSKKRHILEAYKYRIINKDYYTTGTIEGSKEPSVAPSTTPPENSDLTQG